MRPLSAVVAAAVLVLPPGLASAGEEPAPRHVIAITGTSEYGFRVRWSDGRRWWTPTLSETLAECSEHDREVRRARCTTGARTRYRWLGTLKRSLHHAG
jgi:hypothetical protein